VLSTIEKVLFLKEVPFFQGMTVDQLKALATVCEEGLFAANSQIFSQGDPGGALYVVMSGRVGIEQERRKGSFARLATLESHAYFGEMNLFDDSPRSVAAIALQDTLTLRLRREPLIALARRQPELSLELINVLSQRLREANDRIAELTRTKPRELHKLYDQFENDA
jgi:CRP/FNR family transcriptional regulator, cyclic AMP receptor protein